MYAGSDKGRAAAAAHVASADFGIGRAEICAAKAGAFATRDGIGAAADAKVSHIGVGEGVRADTIRIKKMVTGPFYFSSFPRKIFGHKKLAKK